MVSPNDYQRYIFLSSYPPTALHNDAITTSTTNSTMTACPWIDEAILGTPEFRLIPLVPWLNTRIVAITTFDRRVELVCQICWASHNKYPRTLSHKKIMVGTLHHIQRTCTPKTLHQHRCTMVFLTIPQHHLIWIGHHTHRLIQVSCNIDQYQTASLGSTCSSSCGLVEWRICLTSLLAEGTFGRKTPRLVKTQPPAPF